MLFHSIFNAYWEALDFELPQVDKISDKPWKRWIDTALDSPHDILQWETAESVPGYVYRVQARSVVMLLVKAPRTTSHELGGSARKFG
jgi:isoamylase